MDLLGPNSVERAASSAGWKELSPGIRGIWTTPLSGEESAPANRIIHARLIRAASSFRLHRLGLRPATGYHKCGSSTQIDTVTDFRLLIWDRNRWDTLRDGRHLPHPPGSEPLWFDLGNTRARGAILQLRRCEIDQWWTSWNLAGGAPILEGEMEDSPPVPKDHRLIMEEVDLRRIGSGVTAERRAGEVRYRTGNFEVGFWLGRPGFSYLALDDSGKGRTSRNLLRSTPALFLQGPRLHTVGYDPLVSPVLHSPKHGTVRVRGTTVRYHLALEAAGQELVLEWKVMPDGIRFTLTRRGSHDIRVWESSAWTIVCHSEVTPVTALGTIVREGESGHLALPLLFHAPGHGTLRIGLRGGEGLCRFDSNRPLMFTALEMKTGEVPQPEGDYLLPRGEYRIDGHMVPFRYDAAVRRGTPRSIVRAVQRCACTSMSYRADTGTLSNNGNSIHAPLCMDNWSAVATELHELMPGLRATALLRDSLERWLDGGPGYASGGMVSGDDLHRAEDEYIMSGTACLLGLGELVGAEESATWVNRFAPQIALALAAMRARDVDGDGLVESSYRTGITGSRQWSTNWYDVVSFGWKDAFSNALLYRALAHLAHHLPRLGRSDLADGLKHWSDLLKESYAPAFFNQTTGWLAGWRCKRNLLHDYAFLSVNGAAVCSGVVDADRATSSIRALWDESRRVGMPDPHLGLPGNLWPISDTDMIELVQGKPMGFYINGGLTHSQSRHFVGALYKIGMRDEADRLLEALCSTLADGTAYGGCNSGIDWRYWDGGPCGYEGVLTDQFGILAVALQRYGTMRRRCTRRSPGP